MDPLPKTLVTYFEHFLNGAKFHGPHRSKFCEVHSAILKTTTLENFTRLT